VGDSTKGKSGSVILVIILLVVIGASIFWFNKNGLPPGFSQLFTNKIYWINFGIIGVAGFLMAYFMKPFSETMKAGGNSAYVLMIIILIASGALATQLDTTVIYNHPFVSQYLWDQQTGTL